MNALRLTAFRRRKFVLLPTYHFRSITQIPQEFLLGHGLRHVILDVDNTLTLHGHPIPAAGVPEWIQKCRR